MGCLIYARLFESVFDCFDFEYQLHVVAYVRQAIFHAEVGALDLRARCSTAGVFLAHRVCAAIECIDLQRDRLANTHYGQVAINAGGHVALVMDRGGFVADGREFSRVEKIRSAQMIVTLCQAGAQRSGSNGNFNRAGFCR